MRQSLPTWLETASQSNVELRILVVNWGAFEMPYTDPRITVIDVSVAGKLVFHKAAALNLGIGILPTDNSLVVLLDADTEVLDPAFWAHASELHGNTMFATAHPLDSSCGTLVVPLPVIRAAGGFDEGYRGWGSEDLDMRLRLVAAGAEQELLPAQSVRNRPHDDEVRVRYYEDPQEVSAARNMQRLRECGRGLFGGDILDPATLGDAKDQVRLALGETDLNPWRRRLLSFFGPLEGLSDNPDRT